MTTWKIEPCTVANAAALAHNNMSAFWQDPNWKNGWPTHITLPYLIEQSTKRQPRNLLRNRVTTRHQKAVDPATGAVVGYARWILPADYVFRKEGEKGKEGEPEWVETQVPDVSEEERKRFDELAESAWWNAGERMSNSDDLNTPVINRILGERSYIKLDYLAVHPDNKGKGIGTALVQSGVRQGEKMGVPIFCMAYKAGLGIYTRVGFREVERVIQDTAQWGFEGEYGAYFMVYDVPKVVSEGGS